MTVSDLEAARRSRIAWFVLGGMALLAVVLIVRALWTRPPQMGIDERVFKTVDALYTAVRLRDEAKLSDCERRLHAQHEAGALPKDAAQFLDRIIAQARKGEWQAAAEKLYEFMRAQRREGAGERHTSIPDFPLPSKAVRG